jgi:hypothetical protein
MRAVRRRRAGGGIVCTEGRQGWGAADRTGGRRGRWCGTLEPPACIALLRGGAVAPPYAAAARLKTFGAAPPSATAALLDPLDAAPPAVAAARLCCGAAAPPSAPAVGLGRLDTAIQPLSPLAAWETAMWSISMWTHWSEPTRGMVGS